MRLGDSLRAFAEVAARQIYWRLPQRARERVTGRRNSPVKPVVRAAELSPWFDAVAGRFSGLVMVHSSLDAFTLIDERGAPMPAAKAAMWLIGDLTRAVGPGGTLCMPTHPLYTDSPGFMYDKSDLVLTYDPKRTPSSVGLLTELFRRSPGVLRSAHPLSSLAARGPLAEELLADNLNDRRPLPHGRDSGYHRFCLHGGGVIGLGLRVIKPLTILHVAEEVRDETWPVQGFFYERQFNVKQEGALRRVLVRERRPEFVRSLSLSRVRADLLRQGLLEENSRSSVPTDVVDARGTLAWFNEQQRTSTYPYLMPGIARIGAPPKAARPVATNP
ncbi:MAG: AAC(3) family N-acetyltransferase [Pirellulales bacterium]